MTTDSLVWFRNDLRLADNPALSAAVGRGGRVNALYVHETDPTLRPVTGAARWWLENSLADLGARLAAAGIELRVETGDAREIVPAAARGLGAGAVFWNRRYAPAEREIDAAIKAGLREGGFAATSCPGDVLVEPWVVTTGAGKPFQVYTPFAKAVRQQPVAPPLPEAVSVGADAARPGTAHAGAWPAWARKLAGHWEIGEAAAQQVLARFLADGVADYAEDRDRPGVEGTSMLSPYLRFGEISPRQVWHAAQALAVHEPEKAAGVEKFLSEVIWRDFNYHQLYHREDIARVPMRDTLDRMPWRDDSAAFTAWTRGRTGFPIVDAGMRQLWETGWMHNRVRMLVASLLTKNLLIDWRAGEAWFWDTLVDADAASNPGNWQWVAGCGMDAAPYFRIFNPVTQGERFDPEGDYIRRWVPELSALPNAWIHKPFEAPESVLRAASVIPGKTYPLPLADLKATRNRALEVFGAARGGAFEPEDAGSRRNGRKP